MIKLVTIQMSKTLLLKTQVSFPLFYSGSNSAFPQYQVEKKFVNFLGPVLAFLSSVLAMFFPESLIH